MIRKNIAHPFQGAFTRGRRGTDHIFLANMLIDQAKFLGHPLYTAFIDLQKAYDSVCRPLLFRKMVLTGLGPNFCSMVEDMYVNASYRLKVGNRLGVSFSTNVSLRQGDPLSPLLFNLFIADIVFAFTTGCAAPMIFRSLRSNLQMISAILQLPSLVLEHPSNAPWTTVKLIGSKSI